MNIDNAIALVTGANRSIGVAFTRELLARTLRTASARSLFLKHGKIFLDS